MKDIRNITYRGNKTFAHVKQLLIDNGAKKIRNISHGITTIDGTIVTITRFQFNWNNKVYFAACEPETNIFEISTKPIGKFY